MGGNFSSFASLWEGSQKREKRGGNENAKVWGDPQKCTFGVGRGLNSIHPPPTAQGAED